MLLALLPTIIEQNLPWWICGVVVVFGLVIYGFRDLIRFSLKRSWAISSVVFAEAIRRRILWITPLAILGVVVVSQLQKPLDEQDAIRQTIKYSLFAAGLLVTMTAIILACTNLPKEIETRVIYTIVTKPTTRLEIVLGKIIGFAKVSMTILFIMGLFTYGYLHARAWSLRKDIRERLAAGAVDPLSRPTYEYWANQGLLSARTIVQADDFQIFSRTPTPNDTRRWFYGSFEGNIIVPFAITQEDLIPAGAPNAHPGAAGAFIGLLIGFDRSEYVGAQAPAEPADLTAGVLGPTTKATTAPATPKTAEVSLQFFDENLFNLMDTRQLKDQGTVTLTDPTGQTPVTLYIPPEVAPNLARSRILYVNILGKNPGMEYFADARHDPDPLKNPVSLFVPGATPDKTRIIGALAPPTFRTRSGNYGEQLRGGDLKKSPVGIFSFRGVPPRSADGNVGFEMRVGIERSGDEGEEDVGTRVQITVVNKNMETVGQPVIIYPENSRSFYFTLPAAGMADGNFDIYVRNLTAGHYLGLQKNSLSMVASHESFDWNLAKSLSILWMLSVLVVIISIFSSTFLSWPIATVLTVLILLGNWGVMQLSDSLAPGIGASVAQDLFPGSPSQAKVVSTTVEAMSKVLVNLGQVLPDIGKFSAIDDIERGITISPDKLINPLLVLVTFGLPMIVMSYIFLRWKEVAP